MREITHEQWLKEGVDLFGKNFDAWKFVCPACGHVASTRDFTLLRVTGATRNKAYCECIGRYVGGRPAMSNQRGQPCDYAAYGLIDLCMTQVIAPTNEKISVFEFAKPACESR